ncbi:MAG: hypothetical protein M1290_01135 [Candidatus Thermoplasmatota archaeon]|nr:hypothetical protein [Candidatus Thermoplasmatota archaeon]
MQHKKPLLDVARKGFRQGARFAMRNLSPSSSAETTLCRDLVEYSDSSENAELHSLMLEDLKPLNSHSLLEMHIINHKLCLKDEDNTCRIAKSVFYKMSSDTLFGQVKGEGKAKRELS